MDPLFFFFFFYVNLFVAISRVGRGTQDLYCGSQAQELQLVGSRGQAQ